MKADWKIEVVEAATDKVVKTLMADSEREANRIDDGLNINLNHEAFFTRVVPPTEPTK